MSTLTAQILPTVDIILPGLLVSTALYALWLFYTYRQQALGAVASKNRSEESRSPPRRGRKLERTGPGVFGEKQAISVFPDLYNLGTEEKKQIGEDKKLYHMLQNLEDYPESVDWARTRLIQLLDHTTHSAPTNSSFQLTSPTQLEGWFAANHQSSSTKYQSYLSRRKLGGPRELFPTREFAEKWLKLAGCVKYVDGNWVGGVLNHLRGGQREARKLAWQVISEEFGDGDLQKNHVHVYHKLLESLGSPITGDVLGFDGLGHQEGSPRCWSAAVAQQCIGLFAATDFLPESLGFNMAYETLAYHLLVTSYELRELRIDDYYFALHITIDNPDTGHAAMARLAVEHYLRAVERKDGKAEMERMWKRVKAGVELAEGLPTTPSSPISHEWDGARWIKSISVPSPTSIESQMVSLFHRKSSAAENLHCPSLLTFSGYTLEEWLSPARWTDERGLQFLKSLGEKRPWVVKGDDTKSRLVKEIQWGGRMFGAFTDEEVKVVREWVRSLNPEGAYKRYVGENSPADSKVKAPMSSLVKNLSLLAIPPLLSLTPHLQAALLFTSLSILDHFPLHPVKFATPIGSIVLRIMRSQLGFPDLHMSEAGCSGTDDVETRGLWEIAEEHFQLQGDLAIFIQEGDTAEAKMVEGFCADMLVLRIHPYRSHKAILKLVGDFVPIWRSVLGGSNIVDRILGEVESALA